MPPDLALLLLELSLSRTYFHGSKGVRAIEVHLSIRATEVSERRCFNCRNVVEDEINVLLHCLPYTELRIELFNIAEKILNGFQSLNDIEKVSFILSNALIVKISTKPVILFKTKDVVCCAFDVICIFCSIFYSTLLNVTVVCYLHY